MDPLELDAVPDGSSVCIDTAPLIYFRDGTSPRADTYAPLFRGLAEGRWRGVISTITLAELLTGPISQRRDALAERYEAELSDPHHWTLVPVTQAIASRAARLRHRYRLKLPDALQLSTALQCHSAALITHDRDFSACTELPILSALP